jgi:hypothetical protein
MHGPLNDKFISYSGFCFIFTIARTAEDLAIVRLNPCASRGVFYLIYK